MKNSGFYLLRSFVMHALHFDCFVPVLTDARISVCCVCVWFFFCACCKRYIIVLEFHYRSSYLKESKLFDARRQKCFRGLEQRKHSLHSMRQLRGVCSEFWHKHLTFESPSLDVIFVSRDELCSNSSASGLNKEAPACCHDTVAAKWVSMMVF